MTEHPLKYEAVVIGGSMGGLDAVCRILGCMPSDVGMAIIIVLHRLKDTRSPLVELVSNKTKLQVKEADEKEMIQPGYVYFAPANYHLLIEKDKTLSLDVSERVNYSRPSIDVTFESAADAFKSKVAGVILTGANNDGSKGLKAISDKGGLSVVQSPDDAACAVMPQAAIRSTKVDHILSLEDICKFLVELSKEKA